MSESQEGYRKTLNLPQTSFSMKADLPGREPTMIEFWEEFELDRKVNEARSGSPHFILHDGPPYANGNIHLGTAFNKILKDIVAKYAAMTGHFAPFVPGWDCHGQPIEHEVEKQLGQEKERLSQADFRKECREYALHFVDRQRDQFRRLGIGGSWWEPYLTLNAEYEATNIKVFGQLYERGLIYRGFKPIHWCSHCLTALAEAEIEYRDEKSPSILVKIGLKSPFAVLDSFPETKSLVIWTTTPWTLPANVAVAVHPDVEYVAVSVDREILILAKDRKGLVFTEAGLPPGQIVATFKGKDLENLVLEHPIYDGQESVAVLADYVTLDQGTGVVHIAPGHGREDYLTGQKYDLPAPMPVDDRGVFTREAGKFAGLHIAEGNEKIIEDLGSRDALLARGSLFHAYPHCWRCKNPVIFRATEQWFISLDRDDFRQEALEAAKQVKWIPEWSIRRITAMVTERPDWCISRQRAWGVPIPVFYCESCRREVVTKESIEVVESLFRSEGADSWFKKEADEILPPKFKCPHCGTAAFSKESDILDVWFESGVSHTAVLKTRPELSWPADLYLEGSDQHRGWFQSSLLCSVGAEHKAPYKAVLTHGFVVDGEGRKMSKSLGNVIDPLEVIDDYGADILRLWVASADYSVDVAISADILEYTADAYRRLRNTFRFLLGNLADFEAGTDEVPASDLLEIDRWALHRLTRLITKVKASYQDYSFYWVFHQLYNFCVVDLSAFYFDVLKDRLYTSAAKSIERRSAQTAFREILLALTKMLAPILAFTTEEVWQSLGAEKREDSVHLSLFPEANQEYINSKLEERWDRLYEIRDEVLKALEIARNEKVIGNSLEAAAHLYTYSSGELYDFLIGFGESAMQTTLIVSEVEISPAEPPDEAFHSQQIPGLAVVILKASGKKCERCWNWRSTVGHFDDHPTICDRCFRALEPE